MTARRRQLGAEEVKRRRRLTNFTADPTLDRARLKSVREDLRAYDVEALLIRPLQSDQPLRALLRAEGYELARKGEMLDLWTRGASGSGSDRVPAVE